MVGQAVHQHDCGTMPATVEMQPYIAEVEIMRGEVFHRDMSCGA
jgi:hypothetical protein